MAKLKLIVNLKNAVLRNGEWRPMLEAQPEAELYS